MQNGRSRLLCFPAVLILCWLVAVLAFATLANCVWPSADGTKVYKDSGLVVDASHSEDGYIMVKGPKSSKKLKLRIMMGGETMTYDINGDGEYETYPLQLGNGSYSVALYKNTSGKKYSQAGKVTFQVKLASEYAAYLCPNQYVNYTEDSAAVALAEEICEGLTGQREKYEAIRAYIKKHFVYDFIRAIQVQSGAMPDMDYVLENKMGICQDLAALACCMLRVEGVPAQFTIGYAGKSYHAWVVVYIDGQAELYDPTVDCNGISKDLEYTV